MNINRTAISVVLPTALAMILAMALFSRSVSAEVQPPSNPPAPVKTKAPTPNKATPVRATPKQVHEPEEGVEARGPFTTTSTVRVIRYGRSSRARF